MECFFIVTALWVFSVCLHEFGHAYVAYRGGDYTVRDKGYLTLNPLHYTHPLRLWYVQPLNQAFWDLVFGISNLLGVPDELGYEGLRAFRFWQR
jgi:Zn-dependent protease